MTQISPVGKHRFRNLSIFDLFDHIKAAWQWQTEGRVKFGSLDGETVGEVLTRLSLNSSSAFNPLQQTPPTQITSFPNIAAQPLTVYSLHGFRNNYQL